MILISGYASFSCQLGARLHTQNHHRSLSQNCCYSLNLLAQVRLRPPEPRLTVFGDDHAHLDKGRLLGVGRWGCPGSEPMRQAMKPLKWEGPLGLQRGEPLVIKEHPSSLLLSLAPSARPEPLHHLTWATFLKCGHWPSSWKTFLILSIA